MQTRTYQFYSTASQANATSRQIIAPGVIYGISWACYLDAAADSNALSAELSFQSASQMSTDNAQGVIDSIVAWANLGAAGFDISSIAKAIMGLYIPIQTGQLIYLNTSITGAAFVKAILYVSEGK